MSKIQGVPFIQSVINSLTDELKKDLLELVNGDEQTPVFRSMINKNALITAGTDKNKVQFVFLETWNKNYTGYLIYNNSYCVLVGFNANTQDMSILNIDVSKQTCNLVKQPLSILEFRFCLQDAAEHITAGEIDSGSATEDQVLAADGDGGVKWVDVADTIKESNVDTGDAVQLFGFDSQGNLVKDSIPEGILVDQTVIEDSENAVSGGAVYDELADIKEDITDINTALETKANVDGNYPTMTVGVADQLSPYDDESGDDQDEPFNFQATGTGNGTQPDFATGAIALMKEKRGNSVVVNQWFTNPNIDTNSGWVSSQTLNLDTTNHILSFTAIEQYGNFATSVNFILGHKYLVACQHKGSNSSSFHIYTNKGDYASTPIETHSDFVFVAGILTVAHDNASSLIFQDNNASDWTEQQFKTLYCIDLTQWFNGDIPQDLLDHPEHFFRYYQGDLSYNEGELVNANGRYLKTIGRNQWDEETRVGYFDANGVFLADSSLGRLSSVNPIKIIPNTQYMYNRYGHNSEVGYFYFYDKDMNFISSAYSSIENPAITVPSNAIYLHISTFNNYGSTYNHDITISIYYEDESGYDEYYPYEELSNNDTGTETLRSAGSAKDTKTPDGTITRRVGRVDLGDLNYDYLPSGGSIIAPYFYSSLPLAKIPTNIGTNIPNAVCAKYVCAKRNSTDMVDMTFTIDSGGTSAQVQIKDSNYTDPTAFKTAMTGVYLFYELTTPTTEQGTPYSENIVIDDFGSMDFSGTSGVPQGNLIFYPVDYKAFIDTLYNYTDGTSSNIALKSDLASDKSALDTVDSQLLNAIGGTLRNVLALTQSLSLENTAVVDLGNATWGGSNGQFYAVVGNNVVSTNKFILTDADYTHAVQDKGCWFGSEFNVQDARYSTANEIKNAMKGVLLAYEKA